MKKALLAIAATILLVSIVGCSSTSATVVLSGEHRITSPIVATSDQDALVNGNTEFAFDLFQTLQQQQGNILYSPYSISLALAITYAGARNQTATEMANVLHFTLPQERLHPAFDWLDLTLAHQSGKGFQLNIANALWGQKGYTFLDSFINTLGQNYGAGMRLLDFANQSEPSRVAINNWVSDQTKGKIKDLTPQGVIDDQTRLVLTNAIYFHALWLKPFDKSSTSDGVFHLIDDSNVTVSMMTQTNWFAYTSGNGCQAVELPYKDSNMSMVILLPDSGNFTSFESKLSASFANQIISDLGSCRVALTMPKFKYEYACSLADTLVAMGMPTAFSDAADFSGMTGNPNLKITNVLHKAYISVDETSTEASAGSAVVMGPTAAEPPPQPVIMTIDHPFIFLIRDLYTGTILFIGRVMNPNS